METGISIATVKVRGNYIYLTNAVRSYLGVADANKLKVYSTGKPGELLLRRQSISEIVDEQNSKIKEG